MRIGIDTIEIDRIEKSLEIKGFLEKVFSKEEILLFEKRKMRPETIAANFAAKEAFSKALGTGIRGFSLNEVSCLRDDLGAPYLLLCGNAASCAKGLKFQISITHTKKEATAIVIAEETINGAANENY